MPENSKDKQPTKPPGAPSREPVKEPAKEKPPVGDPRSPKEKTPRLKWGRLKATVTIGETTWKTSIWFDTKAGAYLLPIKTSVRKIAGLAIGGYVSGRIGFDH